MTSPAESSAFRVDWLKKRMGRLGGSLVGAITGASDFGSMYTAALDCFQLRPFGKDSPCAVYWAASGRTEEPDLIAAASEKWGYKFVAGPMHFVEDEEFPWMGVTPDALTEDGEGGAEIKYIASQASKEVKELDEAPAYNKDQCMLQRRVCKRKWIDLIRGSAKNCTRNRVQPKTAEEEETYWSTVIPLYREFYDMFLAWYWEYDLARAGAMVELMRKNGFDDRSIGQFLLNAMTDGHERLARGGVRATK